MNEKDMLKKYIDSQLQNNIPADTIKQQLVAGGWGEALVSEVIAESTTPAMPVKIPEVQQNQLFATEQPSSSVEATQAQPSQLQIDVSTAEVPEKYTVIGAFKDAVAAMRANGLGLGIILAISFVFMVVGLVLIVIVGLGMLLASINLGSSESNPAAIGAGVIGIFLLIAAFNMVISSFTISLVGLALNDGAEGRKSIIKDTITTSLKRAPRVLLAGILSSLAIISPLLFALILAFVGAVINPGIVVVALLLSIVAIAISLLLALWFMFVPFVALFEPELPILKTLSRSKQLIRDGGIWFMVKLMLVAMLVSLILTTILPTEKELGDDPSILVSIVSVAISTVFYLLFAAILVVFYRNRKAVRG